MPEMQRSALTTTSTATTRAPATPVTPAAQKQQQPTPTGTWRHPSLNEITRRQYATTFDDRNVRTILINGAVLAISYAAFNATPQVAFLRVMQNQMVSFKNSIPYSYYLLWLIRFVFLANIGVAIWPLVLRYHPDDVADIPLTPSQRLAMGLDPDVETPQTPGSAYASPNYVTPPRYQKSTPRSGFGTSGDRRSPLTGSPRTGLGMSSSNSPFPPSSGSPLFQKVLNGSATKRMGYDSRDSPLSGSSLFMDSGSSNAPSTPTPAGGKASVGLNNKWLYEKRRDSRGSSLFS